MSSDRAIIYRDVRLHSRGWYKYEDEPVAALYGGRSLTGPLVFRVGDRFAWVLELPWLFFGYAVVLGFAYVAVSAARGRLAMPRTPRR